MRTSFVVLFLICAPAIVRWPPPPNSSSSTCTFTSPRLRAEMFVSLPARKITNDARTFWIESSSSAACAAAMRTFGNSQLEQAIAQFLYTSAPATSCERSL